jgi:hypothetical protein
MKRCFKCGAEKPLSEFYKHPAMSDGHLGKCKDCAKKDVRLHYRKNANRIGEYDRERNKLPERRKSKLLKGRERLKRLGLNSVYLKVARALTNGTLVKQPCEVCGDVKTEAHHDDYSKPLDVRWLCFKHHRETHGQKLRT